MTATLPPRDQAPLEETWNLEDIYPSSSAWGNDLMCIDDDVAAVTASQGQLGDGAQHVLQCLHARDVLHERLSRVAMYAQLSVSADGMSPANQAMAARVGALGARVGAATSFITTELVALPDGVLERYLAEEPALGVYRIQLEEVLAERPHVLLPETEATLAALSETFSAPSTIWQRATANDLTWDPVRGSDGQEQPVSIAAYVFGLSGSPDRELRRRGYESLGAGLNRYKTTLATTLATHIKQNVTMARLRHYDSAAEMILTPQKVPLDVYQTVVDVVHDEIAPHVRRLVRLRRRLFNLDRVYRYDLDAPLDAGDDPPTTFAESGQLIREGLRVLGDEYGEIVDAGLRGRWVDRAENAGKRSGAFCATVYGVHSYVFTTWRDNLRSTFILAHEFGHAGHLMLAARNQIISNARPGRFFIEAPSTANELLLGRHILDTTNDPRLRRWVILQFLGTFTHNMVTHLLEAHFERRLYELAESGKPITVKTVMDVQGEVFERFYDGTVVVDDAARLYWAQQPHFYVNLYPFTYAAGLACAYGVSEAIRAEGQPAVDRWLHTLKAGGTLSPLELANQAGVDMASPEPIRRAVAFFGSLVDELERSFA